MLFKNFFKFVAALAVIFVGIYLIYHSARFDSSVLNFADSPDPNNPRYFTPLFGGVISFLGIILLVDIFTGNRIFFRISAGFLGFCFLVLTVLCAVFLKKYTPYLDGGSEGMNVNSKTIFVAIVAILSLVLTVVCFLFTRRNESHKEFET